MNTSIDAIETFPAETEKPIVRELTNRQQVVDVAIYGNTDERSLKRLAERVRDELSALPEITQVELANARPYEVSIEDIGGVPPPPRPELRFRRQRRAPLFAGPAWRFGEDRRRRDPAAHERPGL